MAGTSLLLGALALGGFAVATSRRARRNTLRAEADYPRSGGSLSIDGIPVEAVTQGAGPDLVLIHGASGNHRDFAALIPRLARRYRVTAFDRPSLGWTGAIPEEQDPAQQAELLSAAADKLGLRNPVVVGHSYGGAVALAWALARPGRTRGLVVLSGASHPYPRPVAATSRLLTMALAGRLMAPIFTAWSPPALVRTAFGAAFSPQPVPPGYVEAAGIALTLRPHSFAANARQVAGLNRALRRMAQHYPTLALPVEIVHGTSDAIVPFARNGEALAIDVASGVLTSLSGAGHMIHHTHPDAVVAAIDRAFLRSS